MLHINWTHGDAEFEVDYDSIFSVYLRSPQRKLS